MTLQFLSTSATTESLILDLLVSPKLNIENSVLTPRTPPFNPGNNDIFSYEWEKGSSLNKLAKDYLGDSFLWDVIADANGIDPTKEIDLKQIVKIPSIKDLEKGVRKYIIEDPNGKKLIKDAKDSILNLVGLSDNNSPVGRSLKDCIDKVISFKIS